MSLNFRAETVNNYNSAKNVNTGANYGARPNVVVRAYLISNLTQVPSTKTITEMPCLQGNHMPCKATTTSEVGARGLDRPITMPIPPLLLVIITTNKNIITVTINAPHMGPPEGPVDIKITHVIGPLPKDLIRTRWISGTKKFQVGPWKTHVQGMIDIGMKAKNSTPRGPMLYLPRAIRQHLIPGVNLTWRLLQLPPPTPA